MNWIDRVWEEEKRNACNCPQKFQLIDGLGAGLGAFFILQNIKNMNLQRKEGRKPSGWHVVGVMLGTIMLYVHTARFFYAEDPKTNSRKTK